MRTTFALTSDHHAQSAVRQRDEPHALRVGSPLVFSRPFRTPYGVVPAGARGFVESVTEETGAAWLLMEGLEPALLYWDNALVIVPYDTEELLQCLEFRPAHACDNSQGQIAAA